MFIKNLFHNQLRKRELPDAMEWRKVLSGPLEGYELLISDNNTWQNELINGTFDKEIYEYLMDFNPDVNIAWDIGAHIGYHSMGLLKTLKKNGHVYAFEPNPYNIIRLEENTKRNADTKNRVTIMPYALSNMDGVEKFFFSSKVDSGESSGSHLASASVPEDSTAYVDFLEKEVEIHTADNLINTSRISPPGIIKIDVEGAEDKVLLGSIDTIDRYSPLMFIEIHNIKMMFKVTQLLNKLNYNIKILNEDTCSLSRCLIVAFRE